MTERNAPAGATNRELNAFRAMISSADAPDFQLAIGGYEWAIHSRVLSSKSSFFKVMCGGPYKELSERLIQLHDDCPWTVAHMVYWCYLDEKENWDLAVNPRVDPSFLKMVIRPEVPEFEEARNKYASYSDWQRYAQLYIVANKYFIPDLMAMSREKLCRYLCYDRSLGLRDLVVYIGATVVASDSELMKILLDKALKQAADSKAYYEEVKIAFEEDPIHVNTALDFLFDRVMKRHDLSCLRTKAGYAKSNFAFIQKELPVQTDLTNEVSTRVRMLEQELADMREMVERFMKI